MHHYRQLKHRYHDTRAVEALALYSDIEDWDFRVLELCDVDLLSEREDGHQNSVTSDYLLNSVVTGHRCDQPWDDRLREQMRYRGTGRIPFEQRLWDRIQRWLDDRDE